MGTISTCTALLGLYSLDEKWVYVKIWTSKPAKDLIKEPNKEKSNKLTVLHFDMSMWKGYSPHQGNEPNQYKDSLHLITTTANYSTHQENPLFYTNVVPRCWMNTIFICYTFFRFKLFNFWLKFQSPCDSWNCVRSCAYPTLSTDWTI